MPLSAQDLEFIARAKMAKDPTTAAAIWTEFLDTTSAQDPNVLKELIKAFDKPALKTTLAIKPEILAKVAATKNQNAFDVLIKKRGEDIKNCDIGAMKYAAFLAARGDVVALKFLSSLEDIAPKDLEAMLMSAMLKNGEKAPNYNIEALFDAVPAMRGIKSFNMAEPPVVCDIDATLEVLTMLQGSMESASFHFWLMRQENFARLAPVIAAMPALKYLDLSSNAASFNFEEGMFANTHSLRCLNIASNGFNSKTLVEVFATNPSLETLIVRSCGCGSIVWFFEQAGQMPNLKVLDVSFNITDRKGNEKEIEQLMESLPKTAITTLVMNSNYMSERGAYLLAMAAFKTDLFREEKWKKQREADPDAEIVKPAPLILEANFAIPEVSGADKERITAEVRAKFQIPSEAVRRSSHSTVVDIEQDLGRTSVV